MAKKTHIEKLGLDVRWKLTKTECLRRVRFLKRRINEGKYSGKLLRRAKFYKCYYQWLADQGGTRGKKRAA